MYPCILYGQFNFSFFHKVIEEEGITFLGVWRLPLEVVVWLNTSFLENLLNLINPDVCFISLFLASWKEVAHEEEWWYTCSNASFRKNKELVLVFGCKPNSVCYWSTNDEDWRYICSNALVWKTERMMYQFKPNGMGHNNVPFLKITSRIFFLWLP